MSAPASPPNAAPPVPADPAGLDTANAKDRLESASNAAPNHPQQATDSEIGAAGDSNNTALGNAIIKMTEVLAANTGVFAANTEILTNTTKLWQPACNFWQPT
ncbi:hypothetical protein K443DRAFT_744 [Laccaria amethystina LaAM-08-1]|uniref:Uncharacterized protein n=1 Tax=Laccaria amethystina LaAM-08-1 TaxID=1095629 RepID=A0A0C9Y6L9_9AGAR|nr:hypothetical protein K443DRAFT_744 [Laccaria amethystina LaAM-08-1]